MTPPWWSPLGRGSLDVYWVKGLMPTTPTAERKRRAASRYPATEASGIVYALSKSGMEMEPSIQTRHPELWDATESVEARHALPEWISRPGQEGRETVELERDARALVVPLTGIDRSMLAELALRVEPAPFLTGPR